MARMPRVGPAGRVACLALVSLAAPLASPGLAATFTVDTTADVVDALPGDGACATSTGACSLRAAMPISAHGPQLTLPAANPCARR